jgi:hypothetical protein
MDSSEKIRENRARRIAKRRGFRLEKSGRRDPGAPDYGRYRLREVGRFDLDKAYELTLAQAEAKLLGWETFYRAEAGDHVDAEWGSVITLKSGAIVDIAIINRRFRVEGDGSLRDITEQYSQEISEMMTGRSRAAQVDADSGQATSSD